LRNLSEDFEGLKRNPGGETKCQASETQCGTCDLFQLFFEMLRFPGYHSFVDIGSGTALPLLTFVIKELLFENSETQSGIAVEMVRAKITISTKLIDMFTAFESFLKIDNFSEFEVHLVNARSEKAQKEAIETIFEGEKHSNLVPQQCSDRF
jgi:hypothetical protein